MTRDEYTAKHGPWAEVYTFITKDGTNTTIAIRDLVHEIKRTQLKAELVPVDQKQVKTILENKAVVVEKLAEMVETMIKNRKAPDPIVICIRQEDGLAFIADGHHRLVLADALGQKRVSAFICYPALWQQFVITDLEPLTKEQLWAAPHPSQVKPNPWKQPQ